MNSSQYSEIDHQIATTLRMLAADAVQQANSGHPGAPMGLAAAAYVLWTRFLKHNPDNPNWFDRDRFVLSAGHGSALLYSLLYLAEAMIALEDTNRACIALAEFGDTYPALASGRLQDQYEANRQKVTCN